MKIEDLKNKLENNSLKDISMIWVVKDESSRIITDQYETIISERFGLTPKLIDNLNDIPDRCFIADTNLYILETDNFEGENTEDNCIVICNKSNSENAIQFPKLEEWQFIDYCLALAPGLNKNDLAWLSAKMNQNFFQLRNEILKIAIFDIEAQQQMFEYLVKEGEYDYYSNLKIFDLTNAIFKKDIKTVREVLKVRDFIDLNQLGLVTILLRNFKIILSMQFNPKLQPSDLGISDKQYWAIKKNNIGYYSNDDLVRIYNMLLGIEYKFKFEGLETEQIIDYIICKILI